MGLSVAFALLVAEGVMRALGQTVWTYNRLDAREPTMHETDAELGWRNRPGSYFVPRYHPSSRDVRVTFEEPGRRRTAPSPVSNPEGALVVVGDSVAMGWAINDEETFAWKLQERFPAIEVVNFGTAGYGTYQALLLLNRVLPKVRSPKLVLYDLLERHEHRNAVPGAWLFDLARLARRGHVRVPRASLGEKGELVHHAPEGYVEMPWRERSAFLNVLGRTYMDLRTRGRLETMRAVTEKILLEMDRVAEESGAELLVVFLGGSRGSEKHYLSFLSSHDVAALTCARKLTVDLVVPGEGHPNGKAHTIWADCIAANVAPRLGLAPTTAPQVKEMRSSRAGRPRQGAHRRRPGTEKGP